MTPWLPQKRSELTEGKRHVRFTAVDRNPRSTQFYMGIDCLTLQSVSVPPGKAEKD
jgi:hypothetical protein